MNKSRDPGNPILFASEIKPPETVRRFLVMIVYLIFSVAVGEANVGRSDNTLSPSLINENEDGFKTKGLPGKALLSLKTQRSLVSFKSFNLSRSRLDTSQSELIRRGWTNSDETLAWNPEGIDPSIEIPIISEDGQEDFDITTFNYIHFDYQELYPDNPIKFFLEMVLDPQALEQKNIKKDLLVAGGYKALHDLEIEENQDIAASNLTPKNFWYLSGRMLRLPFKKNWVFAQSGKSAIFQRRFNKDLQSIESMELFLSDTIDISQVKLTLRIGWGGLIKKEWILLWDEIPVKETHTVEGRQFMKIGLGDLVRQRFRNKKNITLKEVVVFIPGDSGHLAPTDPLQSIQFQKVKKSYLKEDWHLPATTQTLSQGRKRFELNLGGMTGTTGYHPKVKSMRLFISPQNKHAYSGVRFLGARANQLLGIQQPNFLSAGEQLNQRWGGRFLTHTPDKNFVEWAHIKSYFSFHNVDTKKQYKSGRDQSGDITVHSNKGALYRFDETPYLLAADLQFHSKDASFSVEFPSFHAAEKDREVTVEWELEGALQMQLLRNFLHPLEGNITRYRLKKGQTPVLKIELAEDSNLEKSGRVSGRVVIKSIEVRDLLTEAPAEDNKLKSMFEENTDSKKLKEEEERSIYESKYIPLEKFEHSVSGTTRLVKPGIVIEAESSINHWRPEPKGLLIQGEGQWVEIDWPAHASLDKDTLFFLGISRGADSILSLEIVPTSRGQKLPQVLGTPNNPVQLVAGTTEIENLKIRMKLRGGPYKISLEEMSLFKPVVLSPEKAFNTPTLVWGETPLTAEQTLFDSKTKSSIKPGSLKAIVSSENSKDPKLSWTTKVNRKLSWIRGLNITYQVPSTFHDNNPCWLQLTLVGTRSKADQKVCFDSANGQAFLPSGFLFQNFGMKLNESLNTINWSVRVDPRKPMPEIPLAINIGMTLDGVDIETVHNDLKRQPIFEWNGENTYPSFSENLLFERLLADKGWSHFQLSNLSRHSNKSLPTLNQKHPYLQTKTIAFESKHHPLSAEEKLQASAGGDEIISSELTSPGLFESKLFKLFLVLSLLWLAFNKKVRSKLKTIWKQIVLKISQPKIFLNRAVGLFVIVPGFWVIGSIVSPEVENIWVCTLFILLAGVFYHEIRWFLLKVSTTADGTHKFISGKQGEIPLFLYFLTMTVLGWSAWQLGQSAYGPHPAMLLIPIVFMIYFFIPWIPDLFTRATAWRPHSRNYSAATMVNLAIVLYIFGNLWNWSEIFLSFGGMVLVSLWGHWAQKNQTKLERRLPGIASPVYAEKGNRYLAGFLVSMGIGAVFLLAGLDALAEHTVNISFFMLVTALYIQTRLIYDQRPDAKA